MFRCFLKVFVFFLLPASVCSQPVAAFSFVNACKGKAVQFTDLSTATVPDTIITRNWTFGDGSSSTLKNPTRTYANHGVYNVRLIVVTVSGLSDTVFHDVETYAVPQISVSPVPFTGCQPLTVNFINNTSIDTGFIANWFWDFGDGNTSTAQSPEHTYWNLFGHTAKMIATSNKGCKDSVSRDIYVLQNPVCDYTASLVSLNDSSPIVYFANQSSGGNIDLHWDFGDGTTSTDYNVLHTFDTCGTYNVILTAIGTNTCVSVANYIIQVCDSLVQIFNNIEKPDDVFDYDMMIFPNPSDGKKITIRFDLSQSETVSCFITDLTGKIVAEPISKKKMFSGTYFIEVREFFSPGIYFIVLNISGRVESRKLIVTEVK